MRESLGTRLRQQRESQNIALATIAERTKIKQSLLEELESDDVSHWPIGIFRRAFIRCYADAIGSFSRLTKPDHTHHAFLAASSAQLGNRVSAEAHTREVLARQVNFMVGAFVQTLHYQQPSDTEHVREGLLKAGLPS